MSIRFNPQSLEDIEIVLPAQMQLVLDRRMPQVSLDFARVSKLASMDRFGESGQRGSLTKRRPATKLMFVRLPKWVAKPLGVRGLTTCVGTVEWTWTGNRLETTVHGCRAVIRTAKARVGGSDAFSPMTRESETGLYRFCGKRLRHCHGVVENDGSEDRGYVQERSAPVVTASGQLDRNCWPSDLATPDHPLSPSSLWAAAERRSGLHREEDPTSQEALERLVRSLEEEADLTTVGRATWPARSWSLPWRIGC